LSVGQVLRILLRNTELSVGKIGWAEDDWDI